MDGALRVRLAQDDPQLIGPEQWWEAKSAPTLYVRGAWHTRQWVAELFWSTPGGGFDARRRMSISVVPDGRFHTYRPKLAGSRLYSGLVTGLRLDPVPSRHRWLRRHQLHLLDAVPDRPRNQRPGWSSSRSRIPTGTTSSTGSGRSGTPAARARAQRLQPPTADSRSRSGQTRPTARREVVPEVKKTLGTLDRALQDADGDFEKAIKFLREETSREGRV